jgi:hypothetical protein
MKKPIASLSLDLDNKWSYLKTHGDPGWQGFPSYLDKVVPRILRVIDNCDVPMTVFVVGQDAALPKNRDALLALADAGHELGNHSFHHDPWLHRYSRTELTSEIARSEEAITALADIRPIGFRGPGYSRADLLVDVLAERGYRYDASMLPSFIGPIARAYYFLTSGLSSAERSERGQLFGKIRDGFSPLRPYWWAANQDAGVVEIPVTTMPVIRMPVHFSYLLYLASFSQLAARTYLHTFFRLCRLLRFEPSLLIHPLDFLDAQDEPELGFFPAMNLASDRKAAFVHEALSTLAESFEVVPLKEHAARTRSRLGLPDSAVPSEIWQPSADGQPAPQVAGAALTPR